MDLNSVVSISEYGKDMSSTFSRQNFILGISAMDFAP